MNQDKNIYTCQEGHKTVTIDVDEGVTTLTIICPHKNCTSPAHSSWRTLNEEEQKLEPEYEWYSPGFFERMFLTQSNIEHVRAGGLIMRRIKK